MRKLSKKISMLMVLAMLVSLFSGVVSASAASSWSFYNKTTGEIVEVKETIEMESNQFADFDLYKDGKAFDTDVYTVKYETSDADVVWVDAKNGKLRADKFETAEAGDKAVISAKIENKNTGAKTTKSFTIIIAEEEVVEPEVPVEEETYTLTATVAGAVLGAETLVADKDYALAATVVNGDGEAVDATIAYTIAGAAVTKLNLKEGEYTVVVTATLDGEVIATEKYDIVVEAEVPEIVSAKQTSLNTVEITFNNADWAKKFENTVKLSYLAGEVEIADLVKSAVAKDAVVTVTLYNTLVADTTYMFSYEGYNDCVATVVGAKADPAYIKVVGKDVPQDGAKVEVKIYTADDVDITAADSLLDNVTYKSLNEEVCSVIETTGDIFFYEVGKSVVIEATYDMGWSAEGDELTDLTHKGVYNSVDQFNYSKPNGYAVGELGLEGTGEIEDAKLSFGNSITIALGEDPVALYAKYTVSELGEDDDTMYVFNGEDEHSDAEYTYYSTNENVVIIDKATGEIAPCKVGSASLYIKKGDTVVGSVAITIKEAKKFNSFSAKIEKKKLSTTVNETSYITVNPKDQYNNAFTIGGYSLELVSVTPKIEGATINSFFKNTTGLVADDQGRLTLVLADAIETTIAEGDIHTVAFNVKAVDGDIEKTQKLAVSIKNTNDAEVKTSTLTLSTNSVDTKLDKANDEAYAVTIKLTDLDKDGYALADHDLNFAASAVTAADEYTVVITKGNDNYADHDHFSIDGNVITVMPVIDADDAKVAKLATGTYKVQLYMGVEGAAARPIKTEYLTITDSTAAVTVVVKEDTIASTTALADALEFYYNGNKVQAGITIIDVEEPVELNNRYYVKNIKVRVEPTVLKDDSEFEGYFEATVGVNKLFKIAE